MWKFHQYLYNKQNITWPLGDTNFIFSCWKYLSLICCAHSWQILATLEDKIRILARPCNILYLQSDGLCGVRNRANQPWMKTSTCRTAHTWKNMIRGSWLDVSLFSHVGKAIRDIWLFYIGLRREIYSAAFQCVNLSMYVIKLVITDPDCNLLLENGFHWNCKRLSKKSR